MKLKSSSNLSKIFSRILKYGFLCAYVLLTLLICFESLMPGEVSSEHSNAVGELVDVPVNVTVKPQSLEIAAADGEIQKTVYVGDSLTLSAVFTPTTATYKQVSWEVSNTAVAQMEGNVITFNSKGVTTVTATSEYDQSITASFEFEVFEVAVTSIKIAQVSSLKVGSSVNISVSFSPSNATNKNFTLAVDGDCATLSGRTLTAKKAGSVTVTATSAENPSITDSITISITEPTPQPEPEPQHIDFVMNGSAVTELNLEVMQTAQLSVRALPKGLSPKNLVWQVQGEIGITYTSLTAFTLTALGEGQWTVTVADRSVSATLTVNVSLGSTPPPTDEVIALTGGNMQLSLGQGRSVEFTPVTLNGLDPAPQKYVYEVTQGSDFVTVNDLGLVIANKSGVATVKVSIMNTEIFTLVTVTVPDLFITSLNITLPCTDFVVGEEYLLSYGYAPSNATATEVVWSCSDTDVASITQDGVCSFAKNGTVVITITAEGGATKSVELSARNVILVKEINFMDFTAFESLDTGHGAAVLKINGCAQIDVIFDDITTYKGFTLSSDNCDVLKVKDNTVTAVGSGSATFTVTCWDGDDNTTPTVFVVDVTVEQQMLSDVSNNWSNFVRKGIGHFMAFFVLGIFAIFTYMLFFKRKWLAAIITVFSGFAIASISEYFQSLVPNRGPSFNDVILDFEGFCYAVIPVVLIFAAIVIVKKIISKKVKTNLSDNNEEN